MCEYCDVRMPDNSGMEMYGKYHLMRILIAESGHLAVRADGVSVPAPWDTFKINYCPMCGKPLNDNDNDEVQQFYIIDEYGEYVAFDNEKQAREYAEKVATKFGVCDLIMTTAYLRISCEVRSCWDDE